MKHFKIWDTIEKAWIGDLENPGWTDNENKAEIFDQATAVEFVRSKGWPHLPDGHPDKYLERPLFLLWPVEEDEGF